jgi:glycosyltransferase involved in cell wall biosynthesis
MTGSSGSPLLSIVTANYNHGAVVSRAIRSVAEQTRPVFEHVVVDDGSTDDSVATISKLEKTYPHLRLITSPTNEGAVGAFGRGLREAKGAFVLFLSADDALLPTAAESLLRVADEYPHAAIVTGDVRFVSVADGRAWRRSFVHSAATRHFSPADIVLSQRKGRFLINGASTMARRQDVIRAGIADPELRWHIDWFAFNTLMYRFGLWYVPSVISEFHVAAGGYSAKARDWAQQSRALDRVFALLASAEFADVRMRFHDSGVLAYLPFVVRYMMRNPGARSFLTRHLAANLVLICGYRSASKIVPRDLLEVLVRLKMRAEPARAAPGQASIDGHGGY